VATIKQYIGLDGKSPSGNGWMASMIRSSACPHAMTRIEQGNFST